MNTSEQLAPNRLGRFLLLDRIAIGGMAEVFLGRELGVSDDLVVIKRILPQLAQDEDFVAAFQQEAELAAKVHHPNVVRIFELGEAAGLPFIAMEYVAGSSLRELLSAASVAGRALPVDVALHLLVQACGGAHAAHELIDAQGRPLGIVHRDITPHNLMVDDDGVVKLLDFGIAKACDTVDQTRTGLLKGKIAYMAPEQCRQERLDRRADVFSLGVVGYQLLTGHKPFGGTSEVAVMQAVLTGRRDALQDRNPDVPPEVAMAVETALERNPGDRYPSAAAFAEAVIAAGMRSGCPPDPRAAAKVVRTLLGPSHEQKRRRIEEAVGLSQASFRSDFGVQYTDSIEAGTVGRPVPGPTAASASGPSNALPRAALVAGALALALTVWLGLWSINWSTSPLIPLLGASPSPAFLAPAPASTARNAPVVSGAPVTFVLAPIVEAADLEEELEPLRTYLEGALGRPVLFHVAPTYREAADAVILGRAPFGMLPPNTVRKAVEQQPAMKLLAVKLVDGSRSTDGFLLVRRDEPAGDVHALIGRKICWTDPWSTTGYTLPRAFLKARGIDPDRDFEAQWSGNHEQALRDLLTGVCDVAATFSANYETADQRGIPTARLRILAITGTSRHDAVVGGPNSDPALTEALRAALLNFDPTRDVGGPRVGDSERISGFVPVPDDYLDPP